MKRNCCRHTECQNGRNAHLTKLYPLHSVWDGARFHHITAAGSNSFGISHWQQSEGWNQKIESSCWNTSTWAPFVPDTVRVTQAAATVQPLYLNVYRYNSRCNRKHFARLFPFEWLRTCFLTNAIAEGAQQGFVTSQWIRWWPIETWKVSDKAQVCESLSILFVEIPSL